MIFQKEFVCRTLGHRDYHDLTEEIQRLVGESGISTGLAHLFVTGSRVAVGTIEHERGPHGELAELLDRLVSPTDLPDHGYGRGFGFGRGPEPSRREGSAHLHLQATLLGASLTLPARDGRAALGSHQRVFLLECDVHPRERTLILTIMGE